MLWTAPPRGNEAVLHVAYAFVISAGGGAGVRAVLGSAKFTLIAHIYAEVRGFGYVS